jgi:predicted unusual protein kinase regulating ubiquinone biosynthesis (AarF/ABC1/UbiB family)
VTESSQSDASESDSSETADPAGDIAPGYVLAQGRLASALPLVGVSLRTIGGTTSSAARRRSADSTIAARHGPLAQRYTGLFGRSRGVLAQASRLLCLAELQPAVPEDDRALHQTVLNRLTGAVPPMPAGLAADMAETELGLALHEILADFSPRPIAPSSIGQVHAAELFDGRAVAVKIQYPGVDQVICSDLGNGELLASFARLGSGLTCVRPDVPALARELTARIREELDYHAEAVSQEAFAAGYRGHSLIRIGETVPELCTRRVLTTELSDGVRWSRARTAPQPLRDRWGEVLFRFAVGSLTGLGMLNADPDPANFLFHPDGAVTFLDFGCVRRYSAVQVRTLQAAIQAAADSDATQLLRVLAEAGYVDLEDLPDSAALLAWLREMLEPVVADQPYTYTPDLAARLTGPELSPSGRHAAVISRLRIPAQFLAVVRVHVGLTAVLAELRATADWAAICREYCGAGAAR